MSSPRTKYYRDKQNGKWAGVCAGIADYTGIDVAWVRISAVLLTIFVFQPLIIAYFVAAMVTEKKPERLYSQDKQEQLFWQGVRQSPARTARDVKGKFRELDRRLADVEHYYTTQNRSLSNEIESLR